MSEIQIFAALRMADEFRRKKYLFTYTFEYIYNTYICNKLRCILVFGAVIIYYRVRINVTFEWIACK